MASRKLNGTPVCSARSVRVKPIGLHRRHARRTIRTESICRCSCMNVRRARQNGASPALFFHATAVSGQVRQGEMYIIRAVFTALYLLSAHSALATEYRVHAGTAQALILSGNLSGGDRLILEPGFHGQLLIDTLTFEPPLVITAAPNTRPELAHLKINNSKGVRIEGLGVTATAEGGSNEALVEIRQSQNIQLDDLVIASTEDTRTWTAARWRRLARHGVSLSGQDISLSNSLIRNVRHGVSSDARNTLVQGNTIELFSGDGIRGLGDDSAYIGNTIRLCVGVDDNHDDGFQSWSLDELNQPGMGTVRNVRVENNQIRNGAHPLSCTLQGIGLFDGIFENWLIRGNTVVVDHWHGITVMGARDVTIKDNIVLDSRPGKPGAPWITITAHKDGRIAQNSFIEGNITMPWSGGGQVRFKQPQPGVRSFGNTVVQRVDEALD